MPGVDIKDPVTGCGPTHYMACPCREEKIKALVEALEFYAAGRHLWTESEASPLNVCPPIGSMAQAALAKYRGQG